MAEDLRAAPSGGVLRARPGAPRTARDDQSVAPAPVAAAGDPRRLGVREVVVATGGAGALARGSRQGPLDRAGAVPAGGATGAWRWAGIRPSARC